MEPDRLKGEMDEQGKLREPFVRLPGEPDHWTFYLKVGDRVCYDYSRRASTSQLSGGQLLLGRSLGTGSPLGLLLFNLRCPPFAASRRPGLFTVREELPDQQ